MAFISKKTLNAKNAPLISGNINSAKKLLEVAIENGIETMPLDLNSLLSFLGIKLIKEEGEDSFSGCVEKRGEDYFIIVNKYHSTQRIRFTIAHELGHYFLHRERLSQIGREEVLMRSPTSSSLDIIEREANDFAADLLMPKDSFIEEVISGNDSALKLSEKFEVSVPAVKYRATQLGML